MRRSLLGITDLTPAEVHAILDAAEWYLPRVAVGELKLGTLRGVSTLLLFYEPSTRTRVSFELAGKLLGSDTISVSAKGSSMEKGEGIADTAMTLSAMGFHVAVVRHSAADAVALFARHFAGAVLNAGAGSGEHPTQALADALILRRAGALQHGKRVAIVGDVLHSRVMRSNVELLLGWGVDVTLVAPPPLLPRGWQALAPARGHGGSSPGVTRGTLAWRTDLDAVLPTLDAVMLLRMQQERMVGGVVPALDEYSAVFGMNARRLKLLPSHAAILHPGPVNRGVELNEDVFADPRCRINDQVAAGVAVRAALLCWACGKPLVPEGAG
jgi:aspartate carbamoyltransferase catalytic subunit